MKSKKPKPRIKVAPPGKRHKSVKDYNRKIERFMGEYEATFSEFLDEYELRKEKK